MPVALIPLLTGPVLAVCAALLFVWAVTRKLGPGDVAWTTRPWLWFVRHHPLTRSRRAAAAVPGRRAQFMAAFFLGFVVACPLCAMLVSRFW